MITDGVRSTRGGYIFSLFVCSHLGGYPIRLMGGTPSQFQGGAPSQVQVGGYPIPGPGGGGMGTPSQVQVGEYPSQVQGGYPIPGPGGYPILGPGRGCPPGIPPHLAGGRLPGVPPHLAGGCPPGVSPTWQGGARPGTPPYQEQHSMYLLHGGRYASCVHAGGLSCSLWSLRFADNHFTT